MPTLPSLQPPPEPLTRDGRPRRVGVEIEFGDVDAQTVAEVVQDCFGGEIRTIGPHRCQVEGTRFGDFTVELDSSYAHPDEPDASATDEGERALRESLAARVGDVVGLWMPHEVVAPPVEIADLPDLDRLVGGLRKRSATGTEQGLAYGFGLQLNPEVVSTEADHLLTVLKAYLILSPWLREDIGIDFTRRLLPYTNKFPERYVRRVVDPAYRPDLDDLIGDYLEATPTRNRELDLLPLFAYIDEERVRAAVPDPHIKARPTFHYRLPNSRVDDPNWGGIVEEWNRWVRVERLAADTAALEEASVAYSEHLARWLPGDWAPIAAKWAAL